MWILLLHPLCFILIFWCCLGMLISPALTLRGECWPSGTISCTMIIASQERDNWSLFLVLPEKHVICLNYSRHFWLATPISVPKFVSLAIFWLLVDTIGQKMVNEVCFCFPRNFSSLSWNRYILPSHSSCWRWL